MAYLAFQDFYGFIRLGTNCLCNLDGVVLTSEKKSGEPQDSVLELYKSLARATQTHLVNESKFPANAAAKTIVIAKSVNLSKFKLAFFKDNLFLFKSGYDIYNGVSVPKLCDSWRNFFLVQKV
jgi:hypothetical protein